MTITIITETTVILCLVVMTIASAAIADLIEITIDAKRKRAKSMEDFMNRRDEFFGYYDYLSYDLVHHAGPIED